MTTKIFLGAMLLLVIVTVFVSFPQLPSLNHQGADSGTFAYMGRVILDGGIPYRDGWDNKTPLVYYLNALAFYCFGVNLWSIWLIQVISFFLTTFCFFMLVRLLYPHKKGLVFAGTLIFAFQAHHAVLVRTGNFTEQYALLFQVLVLLAGYLFLQHPRFYWGFLLGLAASLCFLTRQNTVGAALTYSLVLILARHRFPRWSVLKGIGGLVLGGCVGLSSFALYLGLNGALDEALEAIFIAPALYHHWLSQGEQVPFWRAIGKTLTAKTALITMGLLAPLAIWSFKGVWTRPTRRGTFERWVAVSFCMDIVLANLTNRAGSLGYEHYFITPMPTFALLVLFGLAKISRVKRQDRAYHLTRFAIATYAVLMTVWWLPVLGLLTSSRSAGTVTGPALQHPLVDYIDHHTSPDDRVFVWGDSGLLNFQSNRDSSSRFFYALPLLAPSGLNRDHLAELVHDLEVTRPTLIIDANPTSILEGVVEQEEWSNVSTADAGGVYGFVNDYCNLESTLDEYRIYRCRYDLFYRAMGG